MQALACWQGAVRQCQEEGAMSGRSRCEERGAQALPKQFVVDLLVSRRFFGKKKTVDLRPLARLSMKLRL